MPTVIDELVTLLGVDLKPGTKAMVASFNSSLDKVTTFATWAGAALIGAASSAAYFVKRTSEAAGQLDKFKDLTGISTDRLQGLQYAVEMVGGSADSLQNDLLSLTKSMSSPIPGEYNQALFMLGINVRKSSGELKEADEVLLDISDKFQKMSKVQQLQWASRIGISDDTLLLLQQGRSAIGEYQKQAASIPTIVDSQSLKQAREFTIQMTLLNRIITFVSQTAASAAGPILKQLVSSLSEFLKSNKEFIQTGLKSFLEGVIDGFRKFWIEVKNVKDRIIELIPGIETVKEKISNVIKEMGGTEVISRIVNILLIALGVTVSVLAAKFLLITAALVGAGLAIEDFSTYLQGGESITGKVITKTQELTDEFKKDYPAMIALAEGLKGALKKVWKVSKPHLKDLAVSVGFSIKEGGVKGFIKNTITAINPAIIPSFKMLEWLGEAIIQAFNKVKVVLVTTKNVIVGFVVALKEIVTSIPEVFSKIWKGLGALTQAVWDLVKSIVKGATTKIITSIEEMKKKTKSILDGFGQTIKDFFKNIVSAIDPFESAISRVTGLFSSIMEKTKDFLGIDDTFEMIEDLKNNPIIKDISKSLIYAPKPSGVFANQAEQARQTNINQKSSQVTNHWNIKQEFSGSNPVAVADESLRKMKNSIINLSPGGLAPVAQ